MTSLCDAMEWNEMHHRKFELPNLDSSNFNRPYDSDDEGEHEVVEVQLQVRFNAIDSSHSSSDDYL